jgi:GWxTD domain-containing protein
MRRAAVLMVGLATTIRPAPAATRQNDREVLVTARRFYRADIGTSLQGLARVPFALLDPVRTGAAGFAGYRLTLVVRDASGATLTEQGWSQRVPLAVLDVEGASAVEQFRFALPPGRYGVEVSVVDSASGRVVRSTVDVEAFAAPPPASDLLLSATIREAPDSAIPGPGELLVGGFLVAAQPEPVLTPSQSRLFYYVELYPSRRVEASVMARVRRPDGQEIIATRAEAVQLDGAGVATSGLDLAGLPEGEYRLELEIRLPDTSLVRSAPFHMAGFQTEAAIARAAETHVADVFARFTEDQLDSLYRPLIYIQEGRERGVYEGLSLEGKRNYLRQFWEKRDPTPASPVNEAQREYYALMNDANQQFREGGAGDVPGWRTDRGRIYIKYGQPDEVLRRPQSPTRPYEAWKYTRGRARTFVFMDETGLGHYVLVFTNERREPSRLDWERLLGREAVEDIARF